ncbi:hypothetical protein MHYP_G00200380 [Metynnis hypsauchen]
MCPVWKLLLLLVTWILHSSLTTTEELITITEKTATREEGSCITINCTYKAQEDLQLLWFKDPQWNETEKRFNGIIVYSNTEDRPQSPEYSSRVEYGSHSASCTLRIKDLQISDSGNYKFRYIHAKEKYMSEAFHLTINSNPCKVHLQESQKDAFKESDTVTLQCSTSANCQSYPEWHGYSSAEISESTREDEGQEKVSELQLKVTWMDDGRTLSCRPTGSTDDCLSRKVTLAVEYAPRETKITVSSEDVKEGENVTLYCSSKAHPNASYMWYKDGKSVFSQSTESYTLNYVKPEDSGEYCCQASNHHGKEDSTVMINVKYAPKGVQVKAEPSDVYKGDEVRLTCLVQKSNPEVPQYSYRWYKDNLELQGHSNELYIPSVTLNHTGWYHSQANNGIGSTDCNLTEISVKYAPEGTSIQGPSEIKLGSALHLRCSSNANPEADHYSWYYKSEDMLEYVDLSHKTQHKEFWIEKVALGDSGWYMCSSRNFIGAGLNSTAFRVHILYMLEYVVLSHTSQEFRIEKVAVQDSGWYMCSSRNVTGAGSFSTTFRVDVH